jgi:RNA polymerase sigma-70 factor (ECF subfamily)
MQNADHRSDCEPNASPAGSTSVTLLDRATEGDALAWKRLVLLYTPLVHWWCRRFGVYRPEDIEDVTQDVFATVAKRISRFTKGPVGSFRGWLYTICRHKAGDHFRHTRYRPTATGDSGVRARLEALPEAADSAGESDEVSERIILVRRAIELVRQEFEPETWTAAWRAAVEGQAPADIAAALGMTVGAVYTAKSRVLKRLRDLLGDVPTGFGVSALPE